MRENARPPAPRGPESVRPRPPPCAPPGGSRGAARPRPQPPPAQTPALEASGAREPALTYLLTYLRPPQAQDRRARDNGASAANTPRVSIRGCLLPTLARRRDRGGESDGWERQPHRQCVPCVPGAGLRARSGGRGQPAAVGPGSGGRTQVSRHLRAGAEGGGRGQPAGTRQLPGKWATGDVCTGDLGARKRGRGPGRTTLAERLALDANACEPLPQQPPPGA